MVNVPEPKPFEDIWSSKELENFLWNMETYFKASNIAEDEMVSTMSMCLAGDAKLWWRSRVSGDVSAGRGTIETWESLKKKLKDQFLPCSSAWVAREAMRNLKHTGAVCEYVKDFNSLMLDVKDMADKDRLFNFLAGLQPWAQLELRRKGVKDLQSAIVAAEGLVDFKVVEATGSKDMRKDSEKDKDKGWKSKKKFRAGEGDGASKSSQRSGGDRQKGCFICNGDHLMRDCPKRERLNVILIEEEESTEVVHPRANYIQLIFNGDGGDRVQREKLENVGARPTCEQHRKKKT